MKIKVKYFAFFKEATGISEEIIEVNNGKNMGYLLEIITKKYNLESNGNMIISLNHEYTKEDVRLNEGDEVAIMMPSSGG